MIAYERRASTVLLNLIGSQRCGPILLPENICPIVLLVLLKLGRTVELIDIDPKTLCIDERQVLERWTDRAREAPGGLVYARTYGHLAEVGDFFTRLKALRPEALLVDDRCLCAPTFEAPRADDADAILYSTGYGKVVDIGFGGYALAKSGVPYHRRSAEFRVADLDVQTAAYKSALQCGARLDYIDNDWLDCDVPLLPWDEYQSVVADECAASLVRKRSINAIYAAGLPARMQLAPSFQNWRFNVDVPDKALALQAIQRAGLFASGHYDSLAPLLGLVPSPGTARLHARVINLFNDKHFDAERAHRIVDVLVAFNRRRRGADPEMK